MKILAIESSCDDTSVALIEAKGNNFKILSEKTASQIEVHKKYGGVVPEVAGRMHAENILPLIEEVMTKKLTRPTKLTRLTKKEIEKPDVIAVTSGPGLITGLIVGVEAAKTLSYLWDVPLVAVNHIEGHIHSVEIEKSNVRCQMSDVLCLTVSGGHTELILMKDHGKYERIGATRDDAAGECFDKVAKLVGFDYPGGPKISEFAQKGNPDEIDFPRPMLNSDNFDFSFSGLKTAALYWLKKQTPDFRLQTSEMQNFCASFEQAIIDVLVQKTLRAVEKYNPKTVLLVGGVSANKKLRKTMKQELKNKFPSCEFLTPDIKYAMDNAAMIGVAAYYHAKEKEFVSWKDVKADPNWRLVS
ncbi:MAG: tRNA (adenosine(37)-N6)-threonylcarbamoyltransferase complex transferase subunit TsaD [Patescibacteria group bacterium]